tara:strand:+ start:263 stop:730 length:468 start_codon:yes stop_codon:yes gene_type:complete
MKLKSSTIRTLLGLLLILIGLFLPQIQERIPDFTPNTPSPSIAIEEPTQEIKDKTLKISEKVTDDKDRLELCVFNKVFSERLLDYDADVQQVNDIYTESGKILFKDSLKGKYEGYGAGVVSLISEITGNENHKLTQQEKQQISEVFSGLAWNLSK